MIVNMSEIPEHVKFVRNKTSVGEFFKIESLEDVANTWGLLDMLKILWFEIVESVERKVNLSDVLRLV